MGYFGQQIYNEPMSMYVDPKLDILANSLASVQKRHDENYAQMTALDLMAHNTKVADGDKGIKDAALGRLKAQRDAIAATGDYAYAMPRIGAAVRDFSGDENLTAAKDNMTAIGEAEKQRQAMLAAGHQVLDFNPATNWSTIDPATGKARRFVAQNEKQLDYDTRAQEVSKLLANTENLGLTASNVRDFLQSGSITGISDARVKANLENAITRFMVSPEGNQMKRKLTKIDGMSESDANGAISNYLLTVGRAQVHQKEDINYQVNAPAVQRENREDQQAFDLQRDAINHQQALALRELDYKKAMDLQAAKDKADLEQAGLKATKAGKAAKPEDLTLSPFTNFLSSAAQPGGTTVVDKDIHKLGFPTTEVTDEDGNKYQAGIAQNAILDYGKNIKPESGNFSSKEVEDAQRYFTAEHNFNKLEKDYAIKMKNLTGIRDFKAAMAKIGVGSTQFNPQTLEKANKLVADYNAAKAEFNAVKPLATGAKKYATALQGDNSELANSIGTKISNAHLPFNVRQGENNVELVDGKISVNAQSRLTTKQLENKFNSNEIEYMKKLGTLTSDESGEHHTLNFKTNQNVSANIGESFDTNSVPEGKAFEYSVPLAAARTYKMKALSDLGDMGRTMESTLNVSPQEILKVKGSISKKIDEVEKKIVDAVKNDPRFDAAKQAASVAEYKNILNNYNTASHQDKMKLHQYLLDLGINPQPKPKQ